MAINWLEKVLGYILLPLLLLVVVEVVLVIIVVAFLGANNIALQINT